MNFFFPDHRALYIAECATHSLHNIVTLRGVLVRDAQAWARYLDESLVLLGGRSEVLCAGHNWPTWGRREIQRLIAEQRDLRAWHAQGFYGSACHNVMGIYQRYMGWFDGNPIHLWKPPPVENARRCVDCMGGIDTVAQKAEAYAREGDLRFAATLLGHAVALHPTDKKPWLALASVLERLGYGAESSTWRNLYLSGALDLREEVERHTVYSGAGGPGAHPLHSVEQWLSLLSVRLNEPRAASEALVIDIHVRDMGRWWRLIVISVVLTARTTIEQVESEEKPGFMLSVTKQQLGVILSGQAILVGLDYEGERRLLTNFLELMA
ncbi:uncharacterized protein BP01DRAFT_396121 [Aspergillus saccharolyticus JOP 1030-1]|uniref:Alkyl sulfatase dimerisation domain-containing protein n=1 Tax=Aspergillus saccharolyticus JOP 1030-1 TaxID=1450539 RepID=A0A318YYL5_9EURO|nr:hypothetical protein BP01DRAFT_396121 [Aspergillus saccharolyticus JOP 1030-1]PYH40091.1 hypothetical protein BP01DRAFT_396121 [Aspergillus saccharolyticus JOP 1030-1]